MFRKIVSFILVAVLSLILLTGCSTSGSDQPEEFDAAEFIDDCRILVPASRYDEDKLKDFEIDFPRTVLDKFGKSDYYKNMTEDERKATFKELTKILSEYSYGGAKNGFMKEISVNMVQHTVSWYIKDFDDHEVVWSMPGY